MSLNLPQFLKSNSLSLFQNIVTDNLNYINLEIKNLSPREQIDRLFSNIYYSWDIDVDSATESLYRDWINNSPPKKVINDMSDEDFSKFWDKNKDQIQVHLRNLFIYLNDFTSSSKKAVKDIQIQTLYERPIAYFSMEFGLIDWLHIYSGGLGVLAGDILKQASDTGLPMVGVGIFYHHGYFIQSFSNDNSQVDEYPEYDPNDFPFKIVKNTKGQKAEIEVFIEDHSVYVRAWKMKVGRRDILLLDTNFAKNTDWKDRMITSHLYGGDEDTRIRQEIILGIGGYKMLLEVGLVPVITHMNEGHSAFALLAITQRIMYKHSITFDKALPLARKGLVFTNHTLKTAGNDTFTYNLMQQYLGIYAEKLGIDFSKIFELGTDEHNKDKFSMTIAGLKNAGISNAVSIIHSKAAKNIWPNYNLVPVTNGVHMPTWVGKHIHLLLNKYVHEKWCDPIITHDFDNIENIQSSELWDAHMKQKRDLVEHLNSTLGTTLNLEKPILSWFRRFTAYKRPDVIVSDFDRLSKLMANPDTQIQVLIGGKAHPKDTIGRDVMRDIRNKIDNSGFSDKVIFIPEYNWKISRLLVAGSDIWVNTPRRNEEASGTSGMKAAANGVLQCTTLDGWTDEVDWVDKGFVLDDKNLYASFYKTVEERILPMYYDRDDNGLPGKWVDMMRNSISTVIYKYSSERQLEDYIYKLYVPVLKVYSNKLVSN